MFEKWTDALRSLAVMTTGVTVVLVFVAIASCSAIVYSEGPEVIAAQAEVEKAKTALVEKQSEAIEKLISEYNINPLAARCAIMGWTTDRERKICEDFSQHGLLTAPLTKKTE